MGLLVLLMVIALFYASPVVIALLLLTLPSEQDTNQYLYTWAVFGSGLIALGYDVFVAGL